jgi:hypothetical protein
MTLGFTPFNYLPLYARVAIEWLDANGERTAARLDSLLEHYATVNGETIDAHTRESAHHICGRRFGDTFTR